MSTDNRYRRKAELLVHPDQQGQRVHKATQDQSERPAQREPQVLPDPKVQPEYRATLVPTLLFPVHLDRKVTSA